MDSLQSLGQTGREVHRLKVLAEERLNKLYGCQKLWFCIEETTKVCVQRLAVCVQCLAPSLPVTAGPCERAGSRLSVVDAVLASAADVRDTAGKAGHCTSSFTVYD